MPSLPCLVARVRDVGVACVRGRLYGGALVTSWLVEAVVVLGMGLPHHDGDRADLRPFHQGGR